MSIGSIGCASFQRPPLSAFSGETYRPQCPIALTISSVIFLASPNSIIVLGW